MRVRFGMTAIVTIAVLVAGCGGDDSGTDDTTTTASATVAPTTVATTAGGDTTPGATATATTGAATTTSPATKGDTCTADKAGGELTVGMSSQPTSLDPTKVQASATTGGIELLQIYDSLVKFDPDTGAYEGAVAESLEPDPTFTTWTLTLRPDVTFGNGDPLDATAVKASIERFAQTATGTYRSLASQITSIEVRDPLTAVLTLSEPWSGFPFTLANAPGMIVNTKLADAAGDAFGANPAGGGVGPFEFQSMVPGEEIVLQAKADYWDGPVCIDTLRFVPSLTEQGRYDAFETGEFGAAWMRDPKLVTQSEADGIDGFTTYQNVQNLVLFNAGASESPANDVRVRQAVAHLVDQQSIADRVWDGAGNPTGAVIGESSAWYQDLTGPELDPDAAASLIAEAKADGWDGKLRLICPSSSQDIGITIESQLEAGGIDVDLTITSDFNQHISAVAVSHDFDLATWGMNILDDGLWATLNNNLNSASQGTNFGGYSDPNMDAALADLRVASNDEDTLGALAAVQAAWSDTVPGVVLNAGPARTIYADNVHGIVPQGNLLVRFGSAYVD